MRLLELELGRVLDRDDAVLERDEARQAVEKRRLARAGPSRDEHVQPAADRRGEVLDHLRRERPEGEQVLDPERVVSEAADGEARSPQRERGDDRVHARAVRHPRIDHGRGAVDATADRGDDSVDDL